MDSTTMMIIMLVGLGISLLIMFLIIKAAVKEATEPLRKEMKKLVNLKVKEMKKQGFIVDDLKEACYYADDIDVLKKLSGNMSQQYILKQKKMLDATFE